MTTWNLSPLDVTDLETALDAVHDDVEAFKAHRPLDDVSPEQLRDILHHKERITVKLRTINAYYSLQHVEDTGNTNILAKLSYLDQVQTDIKNELMFFNLWFMHLDDAHAEELINADAVADYRYYLEETRKDKPYTKSEEIERIINIKNVTADNYSSLYNVITNQFTFDFQGEELSQEEVMKHARGDDPELREAAYNTVLSKYGEESTVLSEVYKNIVLDWYNEGVKIRGHDNPITVRNFANDIPDDVVHTLLSVVQDNTDLFTRYFKTKYDILQATGEDYPYSRYHLYAPYELDKDYSYEESKELVLSTFKQFDERFYNAAKQIFDADHVHSHPKQGKRSGAFCSSIHNDITPYIMLNHTGDLSDVFTMMHEFGHGIHGVLAQDQPNLLYNASLPMAETASVFAEMILADRLLDEGGNDEQLALLIHLLDKQYGSIGRQAYFTLFEQEAHELLRSGASKDDINQAWRTNLESQFGEMIIPDEFDHEWNYVPHFHFSPFYCYAYSWGNLLTLALFQTYKEEGESFIDDYVQLLKKGGSESPLDMLSDLGIDPSDDTFWQRGFDVIKDELAQLEGLV
jgi:oligoendopeptidase F